MNRPQRVTSTEGTAAASRGKYRISQPSDALELEADRVADEVLRMPAPTAHHASSGISHPAVRGGGTPHVQRKCAACAAGGAPCPACALSVAPEAEQLQRQPVEHEHELQRQPIEEEEEELQRQPIEEEEEEVQLQRKPDTSARPAPNQSLHAVQAVRRGGEPLSDSARAYFEPRFGADLGDVRVHTGETAARATSTVNARAFTLGRNIAFAPGQFDPSGSRGRRLLAHELTHVLQQGGGGKRSRALQQGGSVVQRSSLRSEGFHHGAATGNGAASSTVAPSFANGFVGSEAGSAHATGIGQGLTPIAAAVRAHTASGHPGPPHADPSPRPAVGSGVAFAGVGNPPPALTPSAAPVPISIARAAQSDVPPGDSDNPARELSFAEATFLELVRGVSPSVADLVENGADNLLEEVLNEGLGSVFQGVSESLDVEGLIDEVMTSMAGMAEAINSGDQDACAYLGSRLDGLNTFIDEFFASETFDHIQAKIDDWHEQLVWIRALFLEPAFEGVMEVLGERFAKVKELIDALINAGALIKGLGVAVWQWVCDYFGIDSSNEEGLADWLMTKAKAIWDKICAQLEPIMEPLTLIGGVLAIASPFGAIQLAREGLAPLMEGVKWLLAHRDDPNLIATAREELGETYLPLLLEGLDALDKQLAGSLGGALEPLGQLQDALTAIIGTLSGGVSELSEFFQSVRETVNALITWFSETWASITEAIGRLSAEAWAAIRPVLAVLSSVAFAIAGFPGATVMVIAGWGWTLLCDDLRVQILEVFLHLAQSALASVQLPEIYGLLQSGMIAFFESLGSRLAVDQEAVLAALDNVAMIIAGANPEFVLGFVGGLGVGIVEAILDPLLLVWDILSLTAQIQMWVLSLAAGQVGSAVSAAAEMGEAAIMGATEQAVSNLTPELMDRFAELAATLEPIVGALQEQYLPAVESLMAGEGMTYEQLMEFLGSLWPTIEAGIASYAAELATGLIDLLQDPSGISWSAGYNMGWFAGTVTVELVATFCSFGVVEAVLGTSKIARLAIDAIKVADKLVGEVFAMLGKFADEAIQMIKTLASKLGDFAKGALSKVFELALKAFDELKRFFDDVVAILMRRGGKAVDEVGGKVAKELAEEAAEKGAKEAAERAAKEAAEKAAKKGDGLTPDGKRKAAAEEGSKKDRDKDKEDDTNEKRAARVAATEAWTKVSAYAEKDLRTKSQMLAQLERQDERVLGAKISYQLEESGDSWSVEATARGELGETAKRDAGDGWIVRDGNEKSYFTGQEDIEGAKKEFLATIKNTGKHDVPGMMSEDITKLTGKLKGKYRLKEIRFEIEEDSGKARLLIGKAAKTKIDLQQALPIDAKMEKNSAPCEPGDAGHRQSASDERRALMNGGEPISLHVKHEVEAVLGWKLPNVMVHKNSSWPLRYRAQALTVGEHIHFAEGRYNESTQEGLHLIGHELAHTMQQRGKDAERPYYLHPLAHTNERLEVEADLAASFLVLHQRGLRRNGDRQKNKNRGGGGFQSGISLTPYSIQLYRASPTTNYRDEMLRCRERLSISGWGKRRDKPGRHPLDFDRTAAFVTGYAIEGTLVGTDGNTSNVDLNRHFDGRIDLEATCKRAGEAAELHAEQRAWTAFHDYLSVAINNLDVHVRITALNPTIVVERSPCGECPPIFREREGRFGYLDTTVLYFIPYQKRKHNSTLNRVDPNTQRLLDFYGFESIRTDEGDTYWRLPVAGEDGAR